MDSYIFSNNYIKIIPIDLSSDNLNAVIEETENTLT